MDLDASRQIVGLFNERQIKSPDQIIDLLRYSPPSKKMPEKLALFKSVINVIEIHLERYLRGSGHPPICSDMVASLPSTVKAQVAVLDPSILRVALFLRAATDYETLPLDDNFKIYVRLHPITHSLSSY
jgi:hypothetical protein